MATSSDYTVRTSGIGYYTNPVETSSKEQLAYMEMHNESTGDTRWFYLKPTGEFAVYRGVETSGRIVSLVNDREEPLDIAVDLNLFSGQMCKFKDLEAGSLADRQLEILTFFGEVERAHASHGKVEEVKVERLDEETRRALELMEDTPSPHSPTHRRRGSGELVVTAESFPGAPVVTQRDLAQSRVVQAKEDSPQPKSSTGVEHLQVPKLKEHERDTRAKMPDSPRPAQTSSWFTNCQCSRRTKIVGLTQPLLFWGHRLLPM